MKHSCPKKMKRRSKSSNSGNVLGFELLESRQMMAFGGAFDGTTLTLTQTIDNGVVIIDNNGDGDAFRVTDLAGMDTFNAAQDSLIQINES